MTLAHPIAGIDVGKDTLDVAIITDGKVSEAFSLASDKPALKKLAEKLKAKGVGLAVLEATGGYEFPLMAALALQGVAFARVNPRFVRYFAKSLGMLAKTDKLDAKCLALFGERVRPEPTPLAGKNERRLNGLMLRRRQLVDARQKERNRRHRAQEPEAKASLARSIAFLKAEITAIDQAIEALIADTPEIEQRRDLIASFTGIGRATANTVVACLPELGQRPARKLKKIVGVAPLNDDSATRQGPRHIAGGRPVIRQALFMAAQTGYRHNPLLREFYQRLRAKGKSHKVALIACVGKIISILSAMVRADRPFNIPSAVA